MKLYIIKFKDWDYDQYDEFVVAAETPKLALKVLEERSSPGVIKWEAGYTIRELKPDDYTKRRIVLGSFNAG